MAAKKRDAPTIGSATLPLNQKLTFSFEYYASLSDEYCLSKFSQEQVQKAMHRLKEINGKTFNDLIQQQTVYHFKPVPWEKTTKPKGFENKALEALEPYHFALLGVNGQLARVFGAYSSGIFYVVWFDLEHKIWPSVLKHT